MPRSSAAASKALALFERRPNCLGDSILSRDMAEEPDIPSGAPAFSYFFKNKAGDKTFFSPTQAD
jgi:hypothetical protein